MPRSRSRSRERHRDSNRHQDKHRDRSRSDRHGDSHRDSTRERDRERYKLDRRDRQASHPGRDDFNSRSSEKQLQRCARSWRQAKCVVPAFCQLCFYLRRNGHDAPHSRREDSSRYSWTSCIGWEASRLAIQYHLHCVLSIRLKSLSPAPTSSCCRKRSAEELVQSEEEVKRQRLAKLAAWRQQQAAAPVKVEQPSSPKPVPVFDDPFAADDSPEPAPQQAAWYRTHQPV